MSKECGLPALERKLDHKSTAQQTFGRRWLSVFHICKTVTAPIWNRSHDTGSALVSRVKYASAIGAAILKCTNSVEGVPKTVSSTWKTPYTTHKNCQFRHECLLAMCSRWAQKQKSKKVMVWLAVIYWCKIWPDNLENIGWTNIHFLCCKHNVTASYTPDSFSC